MRYAVMMRCNDGTTSTVGTDSSLRWVKNQHTITVVVCDTREEAWTEVERLTPRGFNHENATLWVEERE